MDERRMRRYGEAKEQIFIPYWVPGWNVLYTVVGVSITAGFIGFQIGQNSLLGFIGLVVALPIWYRSTQYVEANYEPILEGFLADATELADDMAEDAGPDGKTYSLSSEWDSRLLLTPYAHYRRTVLLLQETYVVPHELTLYLNLLNLEVPVDPPEIEYVDIADVDYRDDELVIETKTDRRYEYAVDERPTAAIDALRARVESAKEKRERAEEDDATIRTDHDEAASEDGEGETVSEDVEGETASEDEMGETESEDDVGEAASDIDA